MTWFKVDDGFYRNPKTAPLSDAATALWLRAATWSCDFLTDGFVPSSMIQVFRGKRSSAEELVRAELWTRREGGFCFHDWFDYQPSAEESEELRNKRIEAGKLGALKRWGNSKEKITKPIASAIAKPIAKAMANEWQTDSKHEESDGKTYGKPMANECPVSRIPFKETKPNGLVKKNRSAKTLISEDWKPTPAHRDLAASKGIDIENESEKFRDWAIANAKKYVDWDRGFSNWLRNSTNFNRSQGYVNKAQLKLEDQQRRIHESLMREEAGVPQLPIGGGDNSYGF